MFKSRLEQLKKHLKENKLDGVLLSAVANITYLSGFSNFSKDEREAYIFVGRDFAYIITDGRYSEAVRTEVTHLELFQRGGRKKIEELFKKHKKEIKTLGIEEDNLTVSEHKLIKKHFKKIKHFAVSRSIKTKEEIKNIENACKLGDRAFEYILNKIRAGISEKELAFEIEWFVKKNGAELSFPTIVAFGKNCAYPHHESGGEKLKQNQFVLMDFGIKYKNYCSDMTRTIFFGKSGKRDRKIYETVLESQRRALEFIKDRIKKRKEREVSNEIKVSDVDNIARDYIKSCSFPPIPHSLGHGVGLEVHEHPHISPKSKEILQEGMVFSIEPGIYIEGYGGVRIEDLYVLEKKGIRQITKAPKNLVSI